MFDKRNYRPYCCGSRAAALSERHPTRFESAAGSGARILSMGNWFLTWNDRARINGLDRGRNALFIWATRFIKIRPRAYADEERGGNENGIDLRRCLRKHVLAPASEASRYDVVNVLSSPRGFPQNPTVFKR